MTLQSARNFQLGTDFSQFGRGIQQGQQIAGQLQIGQERDAESSRKAEQSRVLSVIQGASEIQNIPTDELKLSALLQRKNDLTQQGLPTQDTDEVIALFQSGNSKDANALIDGVVNMGIQQGVLKSPSALSGLTAEQREFASLSKQAGLSDDEISNAIKVKFGLKARAGQSAAERIAADKDITEGVAESQAEITQAKEEAKLQAQLKLKPTVESKIEKAKGDVKASSNIVNESFKRIGSITTNIRNIDRAINAIDRGAKTGVIAKLVPNITAASRELRQIQNELGLDVIGSVTFGALSQGELDLALETAIDLGLEPAALKDVLTRKKAAQNKLIDYLDEQIQFLDDGGTLAGWRAEQKQKLAPDLTQLSDEDLLKQLEAARGGQ
ncbi:MAG: hypothetical protein JKX72_02635 [Robiginitomaculum sp.]|nr:hypothetical protein [Robiginitomaculum sp.]